MNLDQTLLGLCVGVGLAAACGFRVFVPLLVMSIAQHSGQLQLAHGFQWVGSTPAMIGLAAATGLEIAGYYVPWVDHLLDTIATPAAGIAGTLATSSMLGSVDPMLQWALGIIAGGGAAMTVQSLTVGTRAVSTATTAGLANPVVSTVEAGSSTGLSIVSILAPALGILVFCVLLIFLIGAVRRRRRRKRMPRNQNQQSNGQPQLDGGG